MGGTRVKASPLISCLSNPHVSSSLAMTSPAERRRRGGDAGHERSRCPGHGRRPRRPRRLVDTLTGEEYYAFDTEFTPSGPTSRTWPSFRSPGATGSPWSIPGRRPGPAGHRVRRPGKAVAHAAGQDLDVLLAACGALPAHVFDTQIVAGFLGMSSPSLARLVDQVLGVSLPKADRLSDWLERPIPERQVSYAINDVAHLLELRRLLSERLETLGRLDWALDECDQVLERGRPTLPKRRGGSWATSAACAPPSARSSRGRRLAERTAAATNRPRRMVLSDLALQAIVQRPPRT